MRSWFQRNTCRMCLKRKSRDLTENSLSRLLEIFREWKFVNPTVFLCKADLMPIRGLQEENRWIVLYSRQTAAALSGKDATKVDRSAGTCVVLLQRTWLRRGTRKSVSFLFHTPLVARNHSWSSIDEMERVLQGW